MGRPRGRGVRWGRVLVTAVGTRPGRGSQGHRAAAGSRYSSGGRPWRRIYIMGNRDGGYRWGPHHHAPHRRYILTLRGPKRASGAYRPTGRAGRAPREALLGGQRWEKVPAGVLGGGAVFDIPSFRHTQIHQLAVGPNRRPPSWGPGEPSAPGRFLTGVDRQIRASERAAGARPTAWRTWRTDWVDGHAKSAEF